MVLNEDVVLIIFDNLEFEKIKFVLVLPLLKIVDIHHSIITHLANAIQPHHLAAHFILPLPLINSQL